VNKTELVEALAGRLGDRASAKAALDAFLTEVQSAVTRGDKVSIAGFGVFEKRARAARTARNPRTGETVKVKKTAVPAFRPGTTFKDMVAAGKLPKAAANGKAAAASAKKTVKAGKVAPVPTQRSTATARGTKATATKASAAKTTAKTATARKAPARAK